MNAESRPQVGSGISSAAGQDSTPTRITVLRISDIVHELDEIETLKIRIRKREARMLASSGEGRFHLACRILWAWHGAYRTSGGRDYEMTIPTRSSQHDLAQYDTMHIGFSGGSGWGSTCHVHVGGLISAALSGDLHAGIDIEDLAGQPGALTWIHS
jgi:hypothetical protein